MRSSVDFPAPLGPMTPWIVPWGIRKDTSRTASNCPFCTLYDLLTCSKAMISAPPFGLLLYYLF